MSNVALPIAYTAALWWSTTGVILFLNRLPRLHHPLLKNRTFAQATRDKFFLVIECDDPRYAETATRKLLEDAGSRHIELVEE